MYPFQVQITQDTVHHSPSMAQRHHTIPWGTGSTFLYSLQLQVVIGTNTKVLYSITFFQGHSYWKKKIAQKLKITNCPDSYRTTIVCYSISLTTKGVKNWNLCAGLEGVLSSTKISWKVELVLTVSSEYRSLINTNLLKKPYFF